ncbi:hypothetical protein EDD22DRAFT_146826 [Suillus occidentalis]|nr:hypothetical protein EDD22DRAFT_146826 [Suillus occidentalis]
MTSPKLTLQDLSHDILVEILNVTDDATLMACESVSECFHHAIQSVPQLAYRVALKAAGMKENAIPAGTVASQRHAMLQKHICTWLKPVVVDMSPLLPSKAFWDQDQETDGIFGDVLWERLPDYQHRFTNILSHQKWGQKPSWTIQSSGWPRDRVVVDVAQDLLVITKDHILMHRYKIMPEYWIQLQHLQNGQVHPEAGAKMACNRHQLLPNGPIRMHGSHLLMCEHARGFKTWNWRSGDYLLDIDEVEDIDAIFLTEDLLLIARTIASYPTATGPMYPYPSLVVYSISRGTDLLELECPLICHRGGERITPIRFLRDTTPSHHGDTSPFRSSAEDRVIGISLGTMLVPNQPSSSVRPPETDDFWTAVRNAGHGSDITDPYGVRCALYIPMSTIWSKMRVTETQLPHKRKVPWKDWGPDGTHMVLSPDTAGILRLWGVIDYATMSTHATVTTCGTRALEVLPPCNAAGLQYLRIYDFSKRARHSDDVSSESFVTRGESDSHDELAAKVFVEPQFAKTRYPVQTKLVPLPLLPEGAEYVWDTVSMLNEHMLFGRSIPFEVSFYTPLNRTLSRSEIMKRFALIAV